MKDELQRRISAAIDAPGGIDDDAGLRELLDADPQAAAYAHDVARLGRLMRDWPLPEPDDAAFEALASRIEQRLDEALPRGADPTAAPIFDDDDDLRDATAGLLGPVPTSGELEAPAFSPRSANELHLDELESIPPPSPSAAAPKPPPPPSAPAIVREIPKLASAAERGGERFSFPSIPPAPGAPSLGSPAVQPLPQRRQRPLAWVATLAAAAAVGLGVFATTQSAHDEAPSMAALEEAAPAAPAPQATPAETPTAAAEVYAEGAGLERRQRYAVAEPAMPAPPAAAARARPLDESVAARGGGGGRGGEVAGGARAGGDVDALADRGPVRGALRAAARPSPPAASEATSAPLRAEAPGAAPQAARERAPEPDAADLPTAPDRDAVLAALQAVEPAVRACADSERGVVTVRVVVAGTGRVTNATVSGTFAGTPIGSCVARAVRTARFPRFASERFEVTYPFQL